MKLSELLDLIFPIKCIGCSLIGTYLCESCMGKIKIKEAQECPSCRITQKIGGFCTQKCKQNYHFDNLIVALEYTKNDLTRDLLKNYKYRFYKEIYKILGHFLGIQFHRFINQIPLLKRASVVPIPIAKKRLKFRGYNQSELLAKMLAKTFNLNFTDCLNFKTFKTQQAGLSKRERFLNRKDSIELKEKFAGGIIGKDIILVDDVAATCSTLNEASRVLKCAGANKIYCFVLARSKKLYGY